MRNASRRSVAGTRNVFTEAQSANLLPEQTFQLLLTQPEPECLCGALGQVGEGGVLVQSDPLWRALPAARALSEYVGHFHAERNHQGKGNVLLFPRGTNIRRDRSVQCRERLGSCVITIRRQRERGRRLR